MNMQLYIAKNGQQFGPFDADEAMRRLASGEFSMDDLAWTEGEPGWVALRELVTKRGIVVPGGIHALAVPPAAASNSTQTIVVINQKSTGIAYLLLFLLPGIAAHRLYLGKPISALAMIAMNVISIVSVFLLMVVYAEQWATVHMAMADPKDRIIVWGLVGLIVTPLIWLLADLFLVPGMTRRANQKLRAMH